MRGKGEGRHSCWGFTYARNGVADEYQYAAVVENTAGFDFKTFQVRVNLLDKDDVIVESTYASVNNWEDGQKAKFDFWYNEEFEKISVKSDYWEAE